MGQYVTNDEIKTRLTGKVAFDADGVDPNRVSDALLEQLISEAEADVEFDLSPRYFVPFQGLNGAAFSALPTSTQNVIKTLCRHRSVMQVLNVDFGRGSISSSEKYVEGIEKQYKSMLDRVMAKNGSELYGWKYPPLEGIRLARHNELGDDGYIGQILVTTEGDGSFPRDRINDPGESFFNADLTNEGQK